MTSEERCEVLAQKLNVLGDEKARLIEAYHEKGDMFYKDLSYHYDDMFDQLTHLMVDLGFDYTYDFETHSHRVWEHGTH